MALGDTHGCPQAVPCAAGPAGRVRIEEGASLRIDLLRAEDQGWYECRVLFLDRPSDDADFQNGTWIHLTVNGRDGLGVLLLSPALSWVLGSRCRPHSLVWVPVVRRPLCRPVRRAALLPSPWIPLQTPRSQGWGQIFSFPTSESAFFFPAPPTFSVTPPAFVEVRDRDALSLTCTAVGNPQPIVSWKRSDLALQSGDTVQVSSA